MVKILIVEDNEMNQDMLERRLVRKGFQIIAALDGEAGIKMAAEQLPDLVLMDVGLPGMSGWEATRKLKAREDTKEIPIIALTAHATPNDRQKSLEAGCNEFETKPIRLDSLLVKINMLISSISK